MLNTKFCYTQGGVEIKLGVLRVFKSLSDGFLTIVTNSAFHPNFIFNGEVISRGELNDELKDLLNAADFGEKIFSKYGDFYIFTQEEAEEFIEVVNSDKLSV